METRIVSMSTLQNIYSKHRIHANIYLIYLIYIYIYIYIFIYLYIYICIYRYIYIHIYIIYIYIYYIYIYIKFYTFLIVHRRCITFLWCCCNVIMTLSSYDVIKFKPASCGLIVVLPVM